MVDLGLSVDKHAITAQYIWWGIINKAAATQRRHTFHGESPYQNNCHASVNWHVNRKPSALPHSDRLYGKFNKPLSVYCPHALSPPIEKYPFGLWHLQNYEPALFMSPSLFFTPHPALPPVQITSWRIASVLQNHSFFLLPSGVRGQTAALAVWPVRPRALKVGCLWSGSALEDVVYNIFWEQSLPAGPGTASSTDQRRGGGVWARWSRHERRQGSSI